MSQSTAGDQVFGHTANVSVSDEGRYVTFTTPQAGLVPGDTNGTYDVFLRDRQAATTERINDGLGGTEANDESVPTDMTPDGRYIAFYSSATNLVPDDTNGPDYTGRDAFVYDQVDDSIERVSISDDEQEAVGVGGDNQSTGPSISDDGRFVAFSSTTTNLVAGDTNNATDVFVRDTVAQTTERVSIDSSGGQIDTGHADSAKISADGRYVLFSTPANDVVPGDTNGAWDLFLHDRQTGDTERINVDSAEAESQDEAGGGSITADGRYVAFSSSASDLVAGDTNGTYDVFIRDRQLGTTERVNVNDAGHEAFEIPQVYFQGSGNGGISDDGTAVAFDSVATNLIANDSNGFTDVFVRDLYGSPPSSDADGDAIRR